jgi:hypothetical protein
LIPGKHKVHYNVLSNLLLGNRSIGLIKEYLRGGLVGGVKKFGVSYQISHGMLEEVFGY